MSSFSTLAGSTTYTAPGGNRNSDEIKPGDFESVDFSDPDVGITDLSHKYVTIDLDWGDRSESQSYDYAVHSILHFPDGTPLNR